MKEKIMEAQITRRKFQNFKVRILKEISGVIMIDLQQLCDILMRSNYFSKAKSICTSATQKKIKEGGRDYYFIKASDVYNLTRSVRNENKRIAKICDALDQWTSELIQEYKKPQVNNVVETIEKVYTYKDYPITFKLENDFTYVNVTQLGKCCGRTHVEWLRLNATKKLLDDYVVNGQYPDVRTQHYSIQGKGGCTWMELYIATLFAEFIDHPIKAWLIKQDKIFRVEMQEEQIKIPKYAPVKQEREAIAIPEYPSPTNLDEANTLIDLLKNHVITLTEQRYDEEHKIEFYNHFIENRDFFKTSTIADEIGVSPVKLNRFLTDEGICRLDKNQTRVFGSYSGLQAEVYYYTTTKSGKTYPGPRVYRWTKAGRDFILERWKERNPEITTL